MIPHPSPTTAEAAQPAEPTPGPYYVHLPRGSSGGCRTIRTEKGRMHGTYGGTEIATTHGLANDAEDAANARLIAAAPDLLHVVELGLVIAAQPTEWTLVEYADAIEIWKEKARAALDEAGK